jgi:hypothetical protein
MAELMRRKGAIFLAIIILSAAIVAFEFTSPNSSGNQDKPLVHNGMDEPVYEIPSGHTSLGTECQAGDSCALQDMLPILISSLFNPDQELGTGPSPDNGNVSSGTSLGLQIPQQIEIVAEVEVRGTVLSINPQLLRLIVRVEPLQAANKAIITMDSQWLAIDATGAGEGWQLNIKATELEDQAGYVIAAKALEIALLDESIYPVAGNTRPSSMILSPTPLSTSSQVLVVAARGEGMGSFSLIPTFSIEIPTGTPPGTYYSLLTLTILTVP